MKTGFTNDQLIGPSKNSKPERRPRVVHQIAVTTQTLYHWKKRFGGMDVVDECSLISPGILVDDSIGGIDVTKFLGKRCWIGPIGTISDLSLQRSESQMKSSKLSTQEFEMKDS